MNINFIIMIKEEIIYCNSEDSLFKVIDRLEELGYTYCNEEGLSIPLSVAAFMYVTYNKSIALVINKTSLEVELNYQVSPGNTYELAKDWLRKNRRTDIISEKISSEPLAKLFTAGYRFVSGNNKCFNIKAPEYYNVNCKDEVYKVKSRSQVEYWDSTVNRRYFIDSNKKSILGYYSMNNSYKMADIVKKTKNLYYFTGIYKNIDYPIEILQVLYYEYIDQYYPGYDDDTLFLKELDKNGNINLVRPKIFDKSDWDDIIVRRNFSKFYNRFYHKVHPGYVILFDKGTSSLEKQACCLILKDQGFYLTPKAMSSCGKDSTEDEMLLILKNELIEVSLYDKDIVPSFSTVISSDEFLELNRKFLSEEYQKKLLALNIPTYIKLDNEKEKEKVLERLGEQCYVWSSGEFINPFVHSDFNYLKLFHDKREIEGLKGKEVLKKTISAKQYLDSTINRISINPLVDSSQREILSLGFTWFGHDGYKSEFLDKYKDNYTIKFYVKNTEKKILGYKYFKREEDKSKSSPIINILTKMKDKYTPELNYNIKLTGSGLLGVLIGNSVISIVGDELVSFPKEYCLDYPVLIMAKPVDSLIPGDIVLIDKVYYSVLDNTSKEIKIISYLNGNITDLRTTKEYLLGSNLVKTVMTIKS